MAEKSRTEYSAKNTSVAMTARVIAILAGFFTRVVFTHTLSEEYVGINGLFTDILNVLALSELGVGTAITYALYKPIAELDVEKQKSLMRMYRNFYRLVAGFVLAAGLLVIPLMDVLMKNQPQVEHLVFIYLMYLLNSVLSYLLIYKRTLIDAHQLSYIGVLYQTCFLILQYVLQMAVLLCTKNFILYVSLLIICTIANNFSISKKADRMYPYLKEKNVQPLPEEERKDIFQNIRAMLMHKIGNVVVSNTDNLLLSSLVGLLSVSSYSNYYLIIGSVRQVLNQMFQGITASVGNLGVEESRERIKKIFEASFFVGQWMFGLATICLYELLNPFVEISFGAKYVFDEKITLILCLNFYLTGMRQATLVFRDTMGLFWYDRYKSLAEALINLIASLILGHYLGTTGIFLGTMISTVTTSLWVEPYMLYKHRLKESVKPYFVRYGVYAAVTFLIWWGVDFLCRYITGSLWVVCILRLLVCALVSNLVYLVVYYRSREFRLILFKVKQMLQKKLGAGAGRKPGAQDKEGFSVEEEVLLAMLREALARQQEAEEQAGKGLWTEKTEPQEQGKERAAAQEQGKVRSAAQEQGQEGAAAQEQWKERTAALDWQKLQTIAGKHGVLSLIYQQAEGDEIPDAVKKNVTRVARTATLQSYRLLFLSKYLIGRLEEAGIAVVLLKGVATASYYPEPELRKSGDVDILLLEPEKLAKVCEILEASGYIKNETQRALHHSVFSSEDGIEVELHTMLAEPFDNSRINNYLEQKLEDCKKNVIRADVMGVELPILADGYHAYELLLHMLQHFLRSGFGVKLLCDWVVLWNSEIAEEEKQKYSLLVKESGLKGFSDMITQVCCSYLGLRSEQVEWMEMFTSYKVHAFMEEILEAEEFGKKSAERMVVLRKQGIWEYVREFHHQMCLNFPKAGKCFVLWPVLWTITLIRFLHNNRKIRGVSTREILKKAGQRSRIIEQAGLWK